MYPGSLALIQTAMSKCICYIYSGTCVIYGHLGTNQKCPDYQGVLISSQLVH